MREQRATHRGTRRADPGAGHGHSHGHGHSGGGDGVELEVARGPRLVLLGVLALVAVATVVGGVLLWPDRHQADELKGSVGFAVPGTTYPKARIDAIQPACPVKAGSQTEAASCGHVTVTVASGADDGKKVDVEVPPEVSAAGLSTGEQLELIRTPAQNGAPATLQYFGIPRDGPLWWLVGAFAVVVVVVARLRGVMALVGLAVAAVVIGEFVLPGLLTGESAVPVAVVGAVAIMFVLLFSTHGVSIRTSAAMAGTLGGIGVTALVAWLAVGHAHLTGVVDESGSLLTTLTTNVDFQDLLIAAIIIAGLGVLNDVTITQASAVWELRAASPAMTRRRLFASAMRIGRDHVASSIYTLVFAYAGTALTLLLVISLYDRPWLDLVGTEEIAEEVVRSLTGSLGLILAMPITTLIAIFTVPAPREAWLTEA